MDLNIISVRPIKTWERPAWRKLCDDHHYLGFDKKFGHQILYVAEYQTKWVGLIGWASAFSQVPCRDQFIGWNSHTKPKKLEQVANNFRFLILPGYNQPNLASKIMSLNLKRLRSDWKRFFFIDLLLVESFVNSKKFNGTIYKASSWSCIGKTKGFSYTKQGWINNNEPKDIYIKPLTKSALKQLSNTSFKIRNKESRLVDINTLAIEGKGGLIDVLREIKDPRGRQGRRYSLHSVMSVVTCAMLSGADSFLAIHEWSKNLKKPLLRKLRCQKPPGLTTIKDLVYKLDAEQFDEKINTWLAKNSSQKGITQLAVDGKTLRGSKDLTKNKKPVQLLSALLHHEGLTVAQTKIESKTNEIPKLKDLLADLDLKEKVITADALHCQKATIKFLVEDKKCDFVVVVKNNQKNLLQSIKSTINETSAEDIRQSETINKGHGRIDHRTIRVLSIQGSQLEKYGSDFPHVRQIFQLNRQSYSLKGKIKREETVYGITSADHKKYDANDLAEIIRNHWSIENSSHYVRDETLNEDKSRIRTGSAPQIMATIRNLSIGIIRLSGETNIASGIRHFEWSSKSEVLRAIGLR